jgi:hypothetical protein
LRSSTHNRKLHLPEVQYLFKDNRYSFWSSLCKQQLSNEPDSNFWGHTAAPTGPSPTITDNSSLTIANMSLHMLRINRA